MSVRKRGDTFQADVTWGKQRLRQRGFATYLAAEQWEVRTLDRLKRGVTVDPRRDDDVVSLKELLDKTYDRFWKGSKAESTTLANAQAVVKVLGDQTNPATLKVGDVDFLVGKLKAEGLSGGTINRKLAALSKMLKFGKQRGWVENVPHIQRQRESEHRIRWVTDEEEVALLKWCDFYGWSELRDLFTVLVDSGLRISEALALTWADLDNGWIRVWISKGGRARSVPMTDRVAVIFKRRQEEAITNKTATGFTFDKVFTLDRHQADKRWDTIREKMNLARDGQFVIHALRHTCASRLVQRGVDLPSVQQIMGHSAVTTTMRYAHLAPQNLVNAISALQGGKPLSEGQPRLRLAQ